MIKIDETVIERLIKEVENVKTVIDNRLDAMYQNVTRLQSKNDNLEKELSNKASIIASNDFRARDERIIELNLQEKQIEKIKELEYNKGYADAYIQVTSRMKTN